MRFEREAHVLASLNHPNIAQIYGVEESSGTRALVMELVEGRTLDEVTPTLAISDVVAIARQIAEALEAAHEQGIVHRDLKPANVKVRDDGTVKVLDFGLAKAFDPASASGVDAMNSPTLTVHATQMGVVIGTAAYMAPEQARGKAVDKRADIWALGAVLYEMLANARAFEGDTVSDTIAAVLTKDPDWSKVRPDAPRFLTELAKRCLRKDPDTYRDPRFSPDGKRLAYAVMPAGVGTDLWVFDRVRELRTRLTYDANVAEWWPVWTPDGQSIAYSETTGGIRMIRGDGSGERQTLTENKQQWQVPMSFSPDGKYLAYYELHRETSGDIWILPFAPRGQPQAFLKTPFYEGLPMFSPNGRWIAYMSNESGSFELYVRPFPGPGPKYQISGDQTFDLHYWSADGSKLFYRSGDGRHVMSVPVRTDGAEFEFGKPSVLFELNADQYPDMRFWGSFAAAPDGSGFALIKQPEPESSARTYLMLMLDWHQ